MSASLVGSEMCIRDRPRSHRHLTGRGRAAAQRQLVAGGHAGCQGWRLGPVSYTHLTLPTICSV
eukprot:3169778-Alexandrium_andersonii.AAC.1